jgi:DNA-binding XRE family transcriptional regulator
MGNDEKAGGREESRPMKLGSVLRKYRLMSEITVRTLAHEIGVSAPTLNRLENGRWIDGHTVGKILNWLFQQEQKQ